MDPPTRAVLPQPPEPHVDAGGAGGAGVIAIGAALPATPLAHTLGFQPLPWRFFAALIVMVLGYLALVELGKRWFYRPSAVKAAGVSTDLGPPVPAPTRGPVQRRATQQTLTRSLDLTQESLNPGSGLAAVLAVARGA